MIAPQALVFSAIAFVASTSLGYAGPCWKAIDKMQAHIDASVEAIAAAGPFVPPGVSAGMGVQPTPFGIATVEEKMGEVSRNKVDAVRDAMARARAASADGKYEACEGALEDVRRLIAR